MTYAAPLRVRRWGAWAAVSLALLIAPSVYAADLATPTATAIGATPAPTPAPQDAVAIMVSRGQCTFNPASLATDLFTNQDCPASGAEVGNLVTYALQGFQVADYTQIAVVQAYVVKAGLVRFVVQNTGSDTVDAGPMLIRYAVWR